MKPGQPAVADDGAALARRAGQGARWAVFQSAAKHGVDLLLFLALAKLLVPQAFGLVAMAGAVVVLAGVLVEMGLGDALLQRRELTDGHKDAAFWTSLGAGAALAALLLLGAPWIAKAYGQPELTPLLRAMSALFVLNALAVVPQALLQRGFDFRRLALRALVASTAGGLVGVALAAADAQAWALVAQQLVAAGVGLVGLYWRGPWRPRCRLEGEALRQLLGFGRHVLGARFLNVAASKADAFLVGLVLGPLALGIYSVACRLLLALEQLFCQGVDAVALAAFSRAGAGTSQLRSLYLSATGIAATVAVPTFGGLVWLAPDVVHVLVGPAWAPSAELLRILLVAGLLQALTHFNHAVFKACGRPELSLRMAMWSTGLNVATLSVAVHFGIQAVAWSYLLRSALVAPFGLSIACRMIDLPLRQYLARLLPPAAAFALALAAVVALDRLHLGAGGPWLRIGVAGTLGVAIYVLALAAWQAHRCGMRQAWPLKITDS